MTLNVEEARDSIAREWATFADRLARAHEQAWSAQTRLAGWTVADLVVHAVWGVTMEADALRRARLDLPGRADGRTVSPDEDRAVLTENVRQARAELVDELAQLDGQDLSSTAPMPHGDVPIGVLLDVFAMEAGIHGSDLAAALGDEQPLSPTVVRATETFLLGFLPMLAQASPPPAGADSFALTGDTVRITGHWREQGLVVDETNRPALTIEGDDTAVLLFALGRAQADDARLRHHGDRDLAVNFKSYVPGP
jgi:uncharacterized protein (TIGR03083 family)